MSGNIAMMECVACLSVSHNAESVSGPAIPGEVRGCRHGRRKSGRTRQAFLYIANCSYMQARTHAHTRTHTHTHTTHTHTHTTHTHAHTHTHTHTPTHTHTHTTHTHTHMHTHSPSPPHTQALVVASGFKHPIQVDWVDPLFKHVVVAGDFRYLADYKKVFPLNASLLEDLVKRWVGFPLLLHHSRVVYPH